MQVIQSCKHAISNITTPRGFSTLPTCLLISRRSLGPISSHPNPNSNGMADKTRTHWRCTRRRNRHHHHASWYPHDRWARSGTARAHMRTPRPPIQIFRSIRRSRNGDKAHRNHSRANGDRSCGKRIGHMFLEMVGCGGTIQIKEGHCTFCGGGSPRVGARMVVLVLVRVIHSHGTVHVEAGHVGGVEGGGSVARKGIGGRKTVESGGVVGVGVHELGGWSKHVQPVRCGRSVQRESLLIFCLLATVAHWLEFIARDVEIACWF